MKSLGIQRYLSVLNGNFVHITVVLRSTMNTNGETEN